MDESLAVRVDLAELLATSQVLSELCIQGAKISDNDCPFRSILLDTAFILSERVQPKRKPDLSVMPFNGKPQ